VVDVGDYAEVAYVFHDELQPECETIRQRLAEKPVGLEAGLGPLLACAIIH